MATDLNNVTMIGRLTRDAEIKQTPTGMSVCSFSIAVNRSYMSNNEKRDDVSYFNCILWGKAGEAFVKYTVKGSKVAITGYLQQRRWQDKDGQTRSIIEIVVNQFNFLDSKKQEKNSYNPATDDTFQASSFTDDNLPF